MVFFKKNEINVVVAVEVGTHKVAAAVAEIKEGGAIVLLGVGEAVSKGVRKGEVVDFQLANQSIRNALIDAEKKTDAEIHEVYLVLTGSHITSRTIRVKTVIDEEDRLVTQEHVAELNDKAKSQVVPRDHAIVHELLQHYYLDDQTKCDDPVGLNSNVLEASYHLVHGWLSRLETTVRSIVEQNIEVRGYALSSYATAQAILPKEEKVRGSVIIDIGAGTSDYVVYVDGAVVHTGVIAVGGDHVTQDLSLGLRIPYAKAEHLKLEYGNVYLGEHRGDEELLLERDLNFEERVIYRESMTKIMHVRLKELFELIKTDVQQKGVWDRVTGNVFLTGGTSKTRGIDRLAGTIFPVGVKLGKSMIFEGEQGYENRPELATVSGLLIYAARTERNQQRPTRFQKLRDSLEEVLAAMRLL